MIVKLQQLLCQHSAYREAAITVSSSHIGTIFIYAQLMRIRVYRGRRGPVPARNILTIGRVATSPPARSRKEYAVGNVITFACDDTPIQARLFVVFRPFYVTVFNEIFKLLVCWHAPIDTPDVSGCIVLAGEINTVGAKVSGFWIAVYTPSIAVIATVFGF